MAIRLQQETFKFVSKTGFGFLPQAKKTVYGIQSSKVCAFEN